MLANNWTNSDPSEVSIDKHLLSALTDLRNTTNQKQRYRKAKELFRICNRTPNAENCNYVKAEALVEMTRNDFSRQEPLDTIKARVALCKNLVVGSTYISHQFFDAWENLIERYRYESLTNFAITESRKMLIEAIESGYNLGIAQSFFQSRMIMHDQRAEENSNKALLNSAEIYTRELKKYKEKKEIKSRLFSIYDKISSNYIKLKDYRLATKYCEISKRFVSDKRNEFYYYIRLASVRALCNEQKEAFEAISNAGEIVKTLPQQTGRYYLAVAYYYLDIKDYPKALQYCDSCKKYRISYLNCIPQVYEGMGDYKKAAESYKNIIHRIDSIQYQRSFNDLDEMAQVMNKGNNELRSYYKANMKYKNIVLLLRGLLTFFAIGIITTGWLAYKNKRQRKKLSKNNHNNEKEIESMRRSNQNLHAEMSTNKKIDETRKEFLKILGSIVRTTNGNIRNESLNILENKTDDIDIKIQNILECSNEMAKLSDMVTDYLKYSDFSYEPTLEKINPKTLCLMAQDVLIPHMEHTNGNSFSLTVPNEEHLEINGCKDDINYLLTILLNNAYKFTNNGEVNLAYSFDEKRRNIRFSVTDSGIGITEEQRPHIFEMFYKGQKYMKGYGLGLFIANEIAKRMHGKLWLDESHTTGARFILSIPTYLYKKDVSD